MKKNVKLIGRPLNQKVVIPQYREIVGMAGKHPCPVREEASIIAMMNDTNKSRNGR